MQININIDILDSEFKLASRYLPVRLSSAYFDEIGECICIVANRADSEYIDVIENAKSEVFITLQNHELFEILKSDLFNYDFWIPDAQYNTFDGFADGVYRKIHLDGMILIRLSSQHNDISKTISDLANDVIFAAIPNAYPENAQQLPQRVAALMKFFENNPSEILGIDGHMGFKLGNAFDAVVRFYTDKFSNDSKFAFCCATIGLCKAIKMGTIQSGIAARTLYHLLNDNRDKTDILLITMSDEFMANNYGISKDLFSPDLNFQDLIKWRFKHLAYYLAQIVRLQDAFKDADMKASKIGELYFNALLYKSEENIECYMVMGCF